MCDVLAVLEAAKQSQYDLDKAIEFCENARSAAEGTRANGFCSFSGGEYVDNGKMIKYLAAKEEFERCALVWRSAWLEAWRLINSKALEGQEIGQLVLRKRYLGCLKWSEIAQQLDFNVSYIHRIHRQALAALLAAESD